MMPNYRGMRFGDALLGDEDELRAALVENGDLEWCSDRVATEILGYTIDDTRYRAHNEQTLLRMGADTLPWIPIMRDPRCSMYADESQELLDHSNYAAIMSELQAFTCEDDDGDDDCNDPTCAANDHDSWLVIGHTLLVRDGSAAWDRAVELHLALGDYPILDDFDWSEREHESVMRQWEDYARDDVVRAWEDLPSPTARFGSEQTVTDFLEYLSVEPDTLADLLGHAYQSCGSGYPSVSEGWPTDAIASLVYAWADALARWKWLTTGRRPRTCGMPAPTRRYSWEDARSEAKQIDEHGWAI